MKTAKPWSKTTEPLSYDQIYRYFEQALEECLESINEFENDYYQGITSSLTHAPKIQSSKRSVSVNA
ncbi:unnamed protein product, partial [Rotaria socialis]